MAIPEAHPLVQHNIHLDVQPVPRVVRRAALDPADAAGEPHRQVEEYVALVGRGGVAGEVQDVGAGGEGPANDDVKGEEQAAEGVEVPAVEVVTEQGKDDREEVEDDVGGGVLREGLDGAVADEAAPEVAGGLDGDGGGHDGEGGRGEADDGARAAGEAVEGLEGDLEEGGYHDDGEDEDAEGLEAPAADRVGVRGGGGGGVDQVRGGPDDGGGEEVEGGVDEGGEDREGGGEDCDDDFEDEEDSVG